MLYICKKFQTLRRVLWQCPCTESCGWNFFNLFFLIFLLQDEVATTSAAASNSCSPGENPVNADEELKELMETIWNGDTDELWRKIDEETLDIPSHFVVRGSDVGNYRIRTSTRAPLQNFDKNAPTVERRKRRKLAKTRSGSAVRVSVTLQFPSQSKRLSRGSTSSSSYLSCGSSDSQSCSDESGPCEETLRLESGVQDSKSPFRYCSNFVGFLLINFFLF